MKAPEGVALQRQKTQADAKAGCPIESAMKTRMDAGSAKEVVKSDKPANEAVSSLKCKGNTDGKLAEVKKRPAD